MFGYTLNIDFSRSNMILLWFLKPKFLASMFSCVWNYVAVETNKLL